MSASNVYVGMDVHKATISIAAAEEGRDGEVRFIGTVPNRPSTVIAMLGKQRDKHGRLECIYEAGPCAYTLYRELVAAGFQCIVAAPSKIPTAQGWAHANCLDSCGRSRARPAHCRHTHPNVSHQRHERNNHGGLRHRAEHTGLV